MEIVKLCSEEPAATFGGDPCLLPYDDHAARLSQAVRRQMLEDPKAIAAAKDPAVRQAVETVLGRVIETEVIPRLALAHKRTTPVPVPALAQPPILDVEGFVAQLRSAGYHGVLAYVQDLAATGVTPEAILLDLFAPAARRLGDMWKADLCDFVEVTMALSILQQLVRDHSARVGLESFNWTDHKRVLLAPSPGDQHTFGVVIVEKFFRAAGWEVWGGAAGLAFDLPSIVKTEWFGVVGFSLGCEKNLDALVALIRKVRRASRNPQLSVIVGGPAFLERPDLATLIGADATAVDAQSAVPVAQSLLELGSGAC
jgi:methanogenic corrinoid protein MtbC1